MRETCRFMDKKMITVENPLHYNNQLYFNLDASDSSNYGNVNRNPGVIVIEKVPSKKPATIHQLKQRTENQTSITSEKLALAIKLAKLDISNSKYEAEADRNRASFVERLSRPGRPRIKTEFVREEDVMLPPKDARPKRTKTTQYKITKQPLKKGKTSQKIQFREPPAFEDHIREIVRKDKNPHYRHERPRKQRDAFTSTSDLNRELAEYEHQSDFKQFAKTLQTVVKKEKLRKRRNERPPSRSGFLSIHRSPSKSTAKSPYRNAPSAFKSKHFQLSPKRDVRSSRMRSPPEKLHRSRRQRPLKKLEYSSGGETSDAESAREIVRSRKHPVVPQSPARTILKKLSEKEPEAVSLRKKPARASVIDSVVEDIVGDTADEMKRMERSLDLLEEAHEENNRGTYETLIGRLAEIESEENEIRERWKNIKYDDVGRATKAKPTKPKSVDSSPTVINITGSDKPESHSSKKKEPYKFISVRKQAKYDPTKKSTTRPTKDKRKTVTLGEESVKSILQYKEERQRYLQMCFHEPKGQFDPWNIVKELSNEIMSSIMTSVCDEVNDVCENCVDQIFEGEFAEPNQSELFSIVDHSTDISKCEDSLGQTGDRNKHGVSFL